MNIVIEKLTETSVKGNMLLLLEGKQFQAMFAALIDICNRYDLDGQKQYINSNMEVIRKLKRTDIQTWAARIIRIWMIGRNLPFNGDEPYYNELSILKARYLTEYKKITGEDYDFDLPSSPLVQIQQNILNHYLGIPYSKIQNYQYGSKSLTATLDDLRELENEWKERIKSSLTLYEGDKIVMKFPDGFCWVLLARGYCSDEANAMGHCGNAGAKRDDRILSLRQLKDRIDGVDYYEVFLTFIRNGDGKLGEMKGRSNDKPAARYHPYIIALLESDLVTGIRGGGYLPENNFSVNDLTPEQQDELFNKKPQFASLNWRIKKFGLTEDVKNDMVETIGATYMTSKWIDDRFAVMSWENADALAEEVGDNNLISAVNGYDENAYGVTVDEYDIEKTYDALPLKTRMEIGQYILDNSDMDEDDKEYFNAYSFDDVIQQLKDNFDDIYSTFMDAARTGLEVGAEDQRSESAVSTLLDINISKKNDSLFEGDMKFDVYSNSNDRIGIKLDSPIYLFISTDDAASLVSILESNVDGNGNYLYGDYRDWFGDKQIKLDIPRYGFNDFSESAAIDKFFESDWSDEFEFPDRAAKNANLTKISSMNDDQLVDFILDFQKKIPAALKRPYNREQLERMIGTDEKFDLNKAAINLVEEYYG